MSKDNSKSRAERNRLRKHRQKLEILRLKRARRDGKMKHALKYDVHMGEVRKRQMFDAARRTARTPVIEK